MDATGGLERPLLQALVDTGVIAANPCRVRDCAKATGRLAQTEALEAPVLACFAAVIRPTLRVIPDAPIQELVARLARRREGDMVRLHRGVHLRNSQDSHLPFYSSQDLQDSSPEEMNLASDRIGHRSLPEHP
jgi:hypothetical protein